MSLRFARERPDGGVAIIIAAPKEHLDRVLSVEEIVESVVEFTAAVAEDGSITEIHNQKGEEEAKRRGLAIERRQRVERRAERRLLTYDEYRSHVLERNGLTEEDVTELPEDWVPPDDRTFREAWSLNGRAVDVDMGKARNIHMGRIRRARDAAMPQLDVLWTRAAAGKDQAAADAVEARRQVLRDLPSTFNLSAAETPAELKALWPKELER